MHRNHNMKGCPETEQAAFVFSTTLFFSSAIWIIHG
jgi:hypothetical protein